MHGYGTKRIEQELKARGIEESLIRDVIQETSRGYSEEEKARALLAKRFRTIDLNDPKVVSRAAAFLGRRGFSSKVICALLPLVIEE